MKLTIDPEFKALLPALSSDELSRLEVSITKENRCRNPLVVWNGTIVDGHNRHEICTRKGIPFKIEEIEFPDREAAKLWIYGNAVAQRTLSPADQKKVLGEWYNLTKRNQGGDQKSKGKNCPLIPKPPNTAKAIADKAGVSERTVKNAGAFVTAVKKLGIEDEAKAGKLVEKKVLETAKNAIPELKEMLKTGEIPFKTAAIVATLSAEEQTKAVLGGVYGVNQAVKTATGKEDKSEIGKHMPSDGKSCAIMAIVKLDRILDSDTQFEWAMKHIIDYCEKRMNNKKK